MRNFRNLDVWSLAMKLAVAIYRLCEKLPKDEKFGLVSQMHRAVVSIPSNIAEGCSRSSEKLFAHFLEISLGSSFELETQLLVIRDIELADRNSVEAALQDLSVIQKMLNKLINVIKE